MKMTLFALAVITAAMVLVLTGCKTSAATTTGVTIPTTSAVTTAAPGISAEMVDDQVVDFIRNSATFKFDGIQNSISFTKSEFNPISSFRAIAYSVKFQTAHPGHGDRGGLMLAQMITGHTAQVYYDIDRKSVRIVTCCNTWDLVQDKELPKYISGIVISGGSTAKPDGPLDVPHTFLYQVKQNDGSIINVSFKGYPPSPAGDAARAKMTLDFHAGEILIGDFIYASGMLDQTVNTIDLSIDGGYIRTEVLRMEVVGLVTGGGDTTPEGLMDAPRRFEYRVLKEDGSTITIAYRVYPPSPQGDINNARIALSFYNQGIKIGDYLKAYGRYDFAANTIEITEAGDFVKTYPTKP